MSRLQRRRRRSPRHPGRVRYGRRGRTGGSSFRAGLIWARATARRRRAKPSISVSVRCAALGLTCATSPPCWITKARFRIRPRINRNEHRNLMALCWLVQEIVDYRQLVLRTLPDMVERHVVELLLLEQDVMVTEPDLRVVQLVPASARLEASAARASAKRVTSSPLALLRRHRRIDPRHHHGLTHKIPDTAIISLASQYGRYGYRRITSLLADAGFRSLSQPSTPTCLRCPLPASGRSRPSLMSYGARAQQPRAPADLSRSSTPKTIAATTSIAATSALSAPIADQPVGPRAHENAAARSCPSVRPSPQG